MFGVKGIYQPVEKTAPRLRSAAKQPIHLRRQPDGGNVLSQFGLGNAFLPVDFDDSPVGNAGFVLVLLNVFFNRGADLKFLPVFGNDGGNRPAAVARRIVFTDYRRSKTFDVGQSGASQTPSRGEERNCFQNVGFAAAV